MTTTALKSANNGTLAMTRTRIIYWISTGILSLWEISGAFFMNSQMAIDGMHHLQLPDWFRWEVSIGHLIGGILLIVPLNKRIKEWVYVAFGIDFISAIIAYLSIDGITANAFSPSIRRILSQSSRSKFISLPGKY